MRAVLFSDVTILDGTGGAPFAGHVLIKGSRIAAVAPANAALREEDAEVVQGRGATLMPGLIEPHAHLSFTDIRAGTDLGITPPEEHVLRTARCGRTLLEHG